MKRYLKFAALFISILSLFILFIFKTIPTGKLWNGFNVLYVPTETSEEMMIDAFSQSEILEHYELSNQYIPLTFKNFSPEISMLKLNFSNEDFSYLSKRQLYFFDKSGNYKLYYIPTKFKNNLNDCVKILSKRGVKIGVDNSSSYPVFIPIVMFLLFLLLLIFSKKKNVFFIGGIFLISFVICNPFYSCAVSVCLIFLILFFVSNIWKRKDFIIYLFSKPFVPVVLFFSILGSFSTSLKTGFMFLIAVFGIFNSLYVFTIFEDFIIQKRSFIPVKIRSAKRISIYAKKQNQTLISCMIVVFFLIFISIFSNSSVSDSKFAKILLPSSNAYSQELVSLDDYYNFAWNVSSAPYKSLNDKNQNSNFYQYPCYEEVDGKIVETMQIRSFNESFKNQIFDEIDLLNFNSIEKILKSQGENVKTGYLSTSSYHIGFFGIIVMIISLLILLFIYISSIITKGAKR